MLAGVGTPRWCALRRCFLRLTCWASSVGLSGGRPRNEGEGHIDCASLAHGWRTLRDDARGQIIRTLTLRTTATTCPSPHQFHPLLKERAMKPWIAFLGVVSLAASMIALPQGSSRSLIGTWTLNVAKSTYDPGPAPQSETRTYEATPDGVRMTAQIETADGQSHTVTVTFKADGKPYPETGNARVDTVKVTRLNARESRATEMRGGKVVGHMTRVLSKDGKVLTMTFDMIDPKGHEVRVYDKQ